MDWRRSKTLETLRSGRVATSLRLNLTGGRPAEIAARSGPDCLWIDTEHGANDWSSIESQIWAAKAHDVDVMVRVSRGSYSDIIRPLELDAAGIMVPHIMSLEDARAVVRATRFHPAGLRPLDGGYADGAYGGRGVADYLRLANADRFVVFQIEDPEPLENLDAIAALPGYDMLFFGPGDFSHGLGAPGEWTHPRLLEARRVIAETAIKHGKYAGTTASLANLDDLVAMGYRFLNIGADVLGLADYFGGLMTGFTARTAAQKEKI